MPLPPLMALLDAAMPLEKRASAADTLDVIRRVQRTLPLFVTTTWVMNVIHVDRPSNCENDTKANERLVAEVQIYDGTLATFEIRGGADDHDPVGLRWLATDDATPFGWDYRIPGYRRYPEATPDEPDPFVLADKAAEKAAIQRERRRNAAQARREAQRAAQAVA